MIRPTERQLQAFRLRCTGLTYDEVGQAMGVLNTTASMLANAAFKRLSQPNWRHTADRALVERFRQMRYVKRSTAPVTTSVTGAVAHG